MSERAERVKDDARFDVVADVLARNGLLVHGQLARQILDALDRAFASSVSVPEAETTPLPPTILTAMQRVRRCLYTWDQQTPEEMNAASEDAWGVLSWMQTRTTYPLILTPVLPASSPVPPETK